MLKISSTLLGACFLCFDAFAADIDISQGFLAINKEAGGELRLVIAGPNGYRYSAGRNSVELQSMGVFGLEDIGAVTDGLYIYEITEGIFGELVDSYDGSHTGSHREVLFWSKNSGSFRVLNSTLVIPVAEED